MFFRDFLKTLITSGVFMEYSWRIHAFLRFCLEFWEALFSPTWDYLELLVFSSIFSDFLGLRLEFSVSYAVKKKGDRGVFFSVSETKPFSICFEFEDLTTRDI